MIGAGLVARKAVERGLTRQAVGQDQPRAGLEGRHRVPRAGRLDAYLDRLGFNLVGYGCTTCIGNSGPLPDEVAAEIEARNLVVASVLSGNRNFEGRVQQQVRANYLASPPLVVAYALAGPDDLDLTTEPLGVGKDGAPVYLRDIWPTEHEIQETMLAPSTPRCSQAVRARLSAATNAGRPCPCRPAIASSGNRTRPTSAIRRSSTGSRCSRRRWRTSRRPRAGAARRQHHHRSHLAGGLDQEGQPGRASI